MLARHLSDVALDAAQRPIARFSICRAHREEEEGMPALQGHLALDRAQTVTVWRKLPASDLSVVERDRSSRPSPHLPQRCESACASDVADLAGRRYCKARAHVGVHHHVAHRACALVDTWQCKQHDGAAIEVPVDGGGNDLLVGSLQQCTKCAVAVALCKGEGGGACIRGRRLVCPRLE